MREGVFQVGGCGSRFDSHLHSLTHQRSVVQMGLGSSVFNQTTSTLLLPRESLRSQTPPGLISTKGQHRTQKLLSAETSWEKAAGGEAGKGYPAPRDPPSRVPPDPGLRHRW